MQLVVGALAGLAVGATATYWGMVLLSGVDDAMLERYVQQVNQELARERDGARAIAYLLAQGHSVEEVFDIRAQETGQEPLDEVGGYRIGADFILRFEGLRATEMCFRMPDELQEGDCIDLPVPRNATEDTE
ncbi:MAG: hypothetical protein JJ884_03400 [Maricaulis sp.]|uniref:hypothetical protein n=1 Tax=Maricaulis sp. TaxID=1486257 RepID=UPI001B209114|nr:hypothetical protein [Maricaulis sp.]MBO6728180.1 hypothetical protein [Maricaulis sp.]MBO6846543.1 hypothetical protein [Maricaulis sp.]MBO6877220.1 hypothetical protein [Maricaulis sp.]